MDAGGKASELNEEGLRSELEELKEMDQSFNEMKEKIAEMNSRSNTLLDTYRFDEGHNLSHATSRINNLWSKFNDKLVFVTLKISFLNPYFRHLIWIDYGEKDKLNIFNLELFLLYIFNFKFPYYITVCALDEQSWKLHYVLEAIFNQL